MSTGGPFGRRLFVKNGLVTETGQPPPGEEAKHPSYRNIRRVGFEDVFQRLNYGPAD